MSLLIQIVAIEDADPSHTNKCTINIDSTDFNDENPYFTNSAPGGYSVNISEGVSEGYQVFKIEADDKDIDPKFGKASIR